MEELSAAANLPNVLPCPRVRQGIETFAAIFVTDAVIHSIVASRNSRRGERPDLIHDREGWARIVKSNTWQPGRDFEVPTMTNQGKTKELMHRTGLVLC